MRQIRILAFNTFRGIVHQRIPYVWVIGLTLVLVLTLAFSTFLPHAVTNDFFKYPQMWLTYKLMVGLLVSTFGFFWLHTALWF